MHTVSVSPTGSMLSMKRIGRPPPGVVARALARQPERLRCPRAAGCRGCGVVAVVDRAARRQARVSSRGRSRAPVDDPAQRANQEHDVVPQPRGGRRVLDRHVRPACVTGPPSVSSRPWSTASRTSASCGGRPTARTWSPTACRRGRVRGSPRSPGWRPRRPPRPPWTCAQHVVDPPLRTQLDSVERLLERGDELGSAVVNDGVVDVVRQPSPRSRPSAYGSIGTSCGSNSTGSTTGSSYRWACAAPQLADHLLGLERRALPPRRSSGVATVHRCSPQASVDAPSWVVTR